MMASCSRRAFMGGALLTPLLLAGCGGEQASGAAPPPIAYGRDTCGRCGMIISDERYAAALVAPDGTAQLFDDVGEMAQTMREAGLADLRAWVHEWSSRAWIDATTASFVTGARQTSPMGTGVVAFAEREGAEAYAVERQGTILTWGELTAPGATSNRLGGADGIDRGGGE